MTAKLSAASTTTSAPATSRGGVLRRQALGADIDPQAGIEAQQRRPRGLDLGLADIGHGVERLAVKVGLLDHVVIDDREAAHAGAGEILQHRTAETAGADDQHGRSGKAGLPGLARLRAARSGGRNGRSCRPPRRRDPGPRLGDRVGDG